jgi:hypothetical protein
MRGSQMGVIALCAMMGLAVGCGKRNVMGKLPPPKGFNEPDEIQPLDEVDYSEYDDVNQAGLEEGDEEGDEGEDSGGGSRGEPVFEEGMSVDQAMSAAQGTERLNIDQETLGAPLTRPELYAPCKLGPADHFDLKVAVWDGRAVGIDLDMKNEKSRSCVIEQIKQLRWKDKVKSLNTVEYSM